MTRFTFLLFLAVTGIVLFLSSCKKSSDNSSALGQSGLMNQSIGDDQAVQDAQTAIENDITNFLSLNLVSKKKGSVNSLPCGFDTLSTTIQIDTFYVDYHTKIDTVKLPVKHIKYNGTNCDPKRIKTGTIAIKLFKSHRWDTAGAAVQCVYNVSVKNVATGKTYMFQGVDTIVNVNGNLMVGTNISNFTVSHITFGLDTITFPDGTVRTWQHDLQKNWIPNGTNWALNIYGLGNAFGISNLLRWGINRNGANFYTQAVTTIVSNSGCSWVPSGGSIDHTIVTTSISESADIKLIYGVDASGNNTTVTCPDYYKISWIANNGNSGTSVLAY